MKNEESKARADKVDTPSATADLDYSTSSFTQDLSKSVPPKSKQCSRCEKKFSTCVKKGWKATVPKSPQLSSSTRKRNNTVLSFKEKEEIIAQNIKKNLFKATSFDKKLYEAQAFMGIPRIEPKPVTVPQNIVFHCEERIKARKLKSSLK